VINNELINDSNLQWNDLGLLVYLLSKPETWQVNVKHLTTVRSSGRDALYASLKRLRDAGYAYYKRGSDGRTTWFIFDTPQNSITINGISDEANNAPSDIPQTGNTKTGKTAPIERTDLNKELKEKESKDKESKPKKIKSKQKKYSKIDLSDLPEEISGENAVDFIDHRKALKKPLSQKAFELNMKQAMQANTINLTPEQAINETILAGWQGVNIQWLSNRINNNQSKVISHDDLNNTDYSQSGTPTNELPQFIQDDLNG